MYHRDQHDDEDDDDVGDGDGDGGDDHRLTTTNVVKDNDVNNETPNLVTGPNRFEIVLRPISEVLKETQEIAYS